MNDIKCREIRCGTALELITCIDWSTDFACKENMPYDKLEPAVGRSFRMDGSVFILCIRGTLAITLNTDRYVIKANDMIVFLPHSFIKVNAISPDTLISFSGFSSEIAADGNFFRTFHQTIPDFHHSPILSLSADMASFFQQSFSLWRKLHAIPEIIMDRNMAKDIMHTSFHIILRLYKQHAATRRFRKEMMPRTHHQTAHSFVRLSMQYYASEHSLIFYAGKMNISVPGLCRIVKKEIGKTPQEIISSFIIAEAQTQLRTTGRSIKNIAASLGFSSSTSFCRFFRNKMLASPLEYRKGISVT